MCKEHLNPVCPTKPDNGMIIRKQKNVVHLSYVRLQTQSNVYRIGQTSRKCGMVVTP